MAQGMFSGPGVGEVNAQLDREFQQGLAGPQDGYPTFASNFGMAMRGFQGAMGQEDSRLEKAKKMEAAKKEISETVQNTGDAVQYYTKVAEVFRKYGLLDEAFNMEKTIEALKDKDEALSVKKQSELWRHEDRLQKLLGTASGMPNFAQFQKVLTTLTGSDPESKADAVQKFIETGSISTAMDAIKKRNDPKSKFVGVNKDQVPVYENPEGMQFTYGSDGKTKVPYSGPVFKTSQDPTAAGAVKGAELTEGAYFKQVEEFNKKYESFSSQIPAIEAIARVAQKNNYIQGAWPEARKQIARVLALTGFLPKDQQDVLANSETFDRSVVDIVLPKMAALGGNDSNEELKVVMESSANRGWTAAAVHDFLKTFQQEMEIVDKKRKELNAWTSSDRKGPRPDPVINREFREKYFAEKGVKPMSQRLREMEGAKPVNNIPPSGPATSSIPANDDKFKRAVDAQMAYKAKLGTPISREEAEAQIKKAMESRK